MLSQTISVPSSPDGRVKMPLFDKNRKRRGVKAHHDIQPIKLKRRKVEIHSKNEIFLKYVNTTYHHKAPSSGHVWLVILVAIEFIVCALNCMILCAAGMLNTMYIRGYLEYPCGFQGYCCLGIFFLFPLLLLLSLWKRILNIVKYGFLIVGGLCILSGVMILLTYLLYLGCGESEESFIPNGSSAWFMSLIPLWGIGCMIRYWCGRKYGHVFYSLSLIKSYQRESRDFRIFSSLLALYIAVYIVIFSFC